MAEMESFESRTCTIEQARTRIQRCMRTKRPVFLWGPPGIGKSELIAQIGASMGAPIVDVRLPIMQPTDLMGIPFYNKESGKMEWAPPNCLPDADYCSQFSHVIVFLDELNAAAPAVQAAAYQLVLDRKVGNYRLPDNVLLVAAGNRESDKGVTYRMPTPLANRFVHLEVRVDHTSWENWAVLNSIHQDVVGYLAFAKADLFTFKAGGASRAFASPRTWKFVSDFLNDDPNMAGEELLDLVSGCVGEGVAIKFAAHRKIAADLPNPSDILAGKITNMKSTEFSARYSLVISMCYELKSAVDNKVDDDEFQKMADNFLSFMMENFDTELVVMGARTALAVYKLPFKAQKMKSFNQFHQRFGKFILAASNSK